MDWLFSGSQSFDLTNAPSRQVEFGFTLTRNVIAINVDSVQKEGSWIRSGYLIQAVQLPFFSGLVEVSESFNRLTFERTLVRFPINSGNPYRLRFTAVPWLTKFTIDVFEYSGD